MAASSDTANDDGWFPLLSAVEAQDVALVRSLLDDGADADRAVVAGTAAQGVRQSQWIGIRPLLLAAIRGHAHIVQALLGRADIDLGHVVYGETAAFLSAREGKLDVLRLLVDKGAVINKVNTRGQSPASVAAFNGHHEVLRVLVDNHADINRASRSGQTPAYMAAWSGHYDALRILHQGKARLNEPENTGETPLHVAALNGHLDIVYYLARHGADLAHLDNNGDSALDWARHCGHGIIVTLLEAVQSAGGWRDYIARLRLPYCLIRHEVSRTGVVCPVNEDEAGQRGLYHFVFGARDQVVEEGAATLLRAAPDDVFAVIGSYLGVRLTT